jgi:GT2 family glycosyltransferase
LPHTLQPGQSTVVPLWVLPPVVAGTYLLQWDLVIEGVAWFSLRGWPAPATQVQVVQADLPLSARMARRFVQSLGVSADDLDSPDRRARAAAELQRNGAVRLDRVATPALQLRKLPVVRRLRRPPLTVLMTAYNSARYLAESTASVLSQSFDDFEFLIVDDGSDDWTAAALANIATDSRVRVFRHSHQGNPRSLNAGLAQARAQLIAIMDSDDVALPGRLEAEIKYLDEHPECVLVGGQVTLIDADGQPSAEASAVPQIKLAHEEIDLALLTAGWPVVHGSVVMRTEAVRRVGGYCDEFPASADHDLFLRLAECGQLANLPQVLLKYRRHSASVTARFPREGAQSVAEAIRRAVRRRASRKPTQTGSC